MIFSSLLLGGFAVMTESIIRIYVEPLDLFEQSVDVFLSARTKSAIFGDSIVAAGVIPETPDFVNLATGGESLDMLRRKVEIFFSDKEGGRAVIAANHNLMTRQLNGFADYDEIFAGKSRARFRIAEKRHRAYSLKYWNVFLFEKFDSRRKTLKHGGEIYVRAELNRRYVDKPEHARETHARNKVLQEAPIHSDRIPINRHRFEDTLNYLKLHGVQVCVVVFPMSPELRAIADQQAEFAATRRYFQQEAESRAMRFVNFWAYFDDAAMFIDPTHMSEDGARNFTPELINRCFPKPRDTNT